MKVRKFLSLLLCAVMCLSLAPTAALALNDPMSEAAGFWYSITQEKNENGAQADVTLHLEPKEEIEIMEVVLPDGETIPYAGEDLPAVITENGNHQFTVRYGDMEEILPFTVEGLTKAENNVLEDTEPVNLLDETSEQDEKSEENQIAPKAGITSFTGQDLVDAGLIEDINFANAIAESIMADTDNFYGDYYGDTSKTIESYDTLEDVLQNFTGVIDAKDRGITSLVGFPNLRHALEVHVENNEISDLTPIAVEEQDYYGDVRKRPKYRNTEVYIAGNPATKFPEDFGGALDFPDFSDAGFISEVYTFISTGETPDFNASIDTGIQIGDGYATMNEKPFSLYFEDGQFMTTNFDLYENLSETNAEIDRTQINTDHLYILNHIKSTGFGYGGFAQLNSYEGGLQVNWRRAEKSNITPSSSTREWTLPIATQIMSKVEKGTLQSDFSIDFTKTSAETNQVLPGATYGLYRDGTDELIDSYTTGEDGAFSIQASDMADGEYYLKEITAPAGYQLNSEKIPLTLKNGSITLTSKTGSKVTENTGSATQEHDLGDKGVFAIGGGMLTMPDPDNPGQSITVDPAGLDLQIILPEVNGQKGTLKSLTVTRTKGNNTTITEQEMEKTFTGSVEEVEKAALEFINKAVTEYAHVEVSAEFEMNAKATQSDKVSSSFEITKETFGGAEEDKDKEFSFTVTLEKDGQPYTGDYTIDGEAGTDKDGSFEVSLKGGESVVIGGLDEGTGYTVTESEIEGWQAEQESISGVTQADKVTEGKAEPATSADFVNIKIPKLSYEMDKNRVTPAKLKPGTTKYGFEKGDTVEYAVTIQNTGDCDLTMDVTDRFADTDKFTDLKVTKVEGATKNRDLTDKVGVNITVKAGETATVTFTAIVAKDIENLSDAITDDGKGYENTAEVSNVKGIYKYGNDKTIIYSPDPKDGETQYPDNSEGINPLDPQEDTATTPVYKADEEQPPVEPTDPEPSDPGNPNQPTDPSQPENPGTPDDNPKNPGEPGKSDIPKTGDENNINFWGTLLFLSGTGLASMSLYYRKKKGKS